MRPGAFNEYQQAIVSVGEILANYDPLQQFACYGFGGVVNRVTNHCFALNGNPVNPVVYGVQGMLDAYEKALLNVGLSGPTNFATIINTAAAAAQSFVEGYRADKQRYAVLLIMTDGQITDMTQTIEAIARAAALPLSIIIVGVGRDDFSNMSILDGDERKISSRDIVQVPLSFVFRKTKS
jgi:hypothetical protein